MKWGHQWPGFTTVGGKFGEVRKFKRPTRFFDADNHDLPDEVEDSSVHRRIGPTAELRRPDRYAPTGTRNRYALTYAPDGWGCVPPTVRP